MNCGLFGVRFSVLWHKKGAIAPVDYSSTFATAPFCTFIDLLIVYGFELGFCKGDTASCRNFLCICSVFFLHPFRITKLDVIDTNI